MSNLPVRSLFHQVGIPDAYKKIIILCLLSGLVFLRPLEPAPKGEDPFKIAICDVGPGQKVPPQFVDMLLVELGKYPDVALLEREQVRELLREQTISLALSGDQAVQAGKICATDAFLMLEAVGSGKESLFRLRLVDTKYGLKFWDTSIALAAKPESYQERAEKIAQVVRQRIAKIKTSDNLTPTGVSTFRRIGVRS